MAVRTTRITYRRTKSGEWVVYGPASAILPNCSVIVSKRDGSTKTETVRKVGKPFVVDGVEMVYGYLDRPANGSTSSDRHPCAGCGRMIPARYTECRACEDDMLAEDLGIGYGRGARYGRFGR